MFAEPSFAAQQLQASGSLFFREPQLVLGGLVVAAGDWVRAMGAQERAGRERLVETYGKLHAAWGVYCLNALKAGELPAYYSAVAEDYTLLTLEALRGADSAPLKSNPLSYKGTSHPHRAAVLLNREFQALGRGEKTAETMLENFKHSALRERLREAHAKGELAFSEEHRKSYDFWDTEIARPFVTLDLKLNAYDRFRQLGTLLERIDQDGLLGDFLSSSELRVLKNHIFFPKSFAIAPLEAAFIIADKVMKLDGLTAGKLPEVLAEFETYFQRYRPRYGAFYGGLSKLKSLLTAERVLEDALISEGRRLIELTPQVEDELTHYGKFMRLFEKIENTSLLNEKTAKLLESVQVEFAVLSLLHGQEADIHA